MSSEFLLNIVRCFLLLLLQIVVFNNMDIFGYINPYPYILFIILYPVNANRYGLVFLSFLLGIAMDMFCNTGGVHASASLLLAYYRHQIFRLSYGLSYEYQTIKVAHSTIQEQIVFVGFCVLLHHTILFLLEAFNLSIIGTTLLKILLSGVFTTIFSVLIINLFKVSKR